MMPHLGVLATVDERAATDVFEHDCLIYLGTCVAPVGNGKIGSTCASYALELPEGTREGELRVGDLVRFELAAEQQARIRLRPARGWDAGAGKGQELVATVRGGEAGLAIDGRGRPIQLSARVAERLEQVRSWSAAMGLY